MPTLRRFSIVLLALTALVVLAYSVYEMTPERRAGREARRVGARLKRLVDELIDENPEEGIRIEYNKKRKRWARLQNELLEIACRCELPVDKIVEHGAHRKGCLFFELLKELSDHWIERKWEKERARRALEESRR